MPTASPPSSDALPGWRVVLAALLAAPDRTLTNTQLAALQGVQAWHQRISDLRRRGYHLTPAIRLDGGYFAYALLGKAGTDVQHAPGLDVLGPSDLEQAARDAEERIRRDAARLREGAARPQTPPRVAPPARDRDDDWQVLGSLQEMADAIDPMHGSYTLEHQDLAEVAADVAEEVVARLRRHDRAYTTLLSILPGASQRAQIDELAAALATELGQARAELHPTSTEAVPRRERAKGGPSGPKVIERIMQAVARPLRVRTMVELLDLDPESPYTGSGVEQTVAGVVGRSARQEGAFVKVAPGVFALRSWPEADQDAARVVADDDGEAAEIVRRAVLAGWQS